MKTIYKSLLAMMAAAPLLTGCIEEVVPTSGIIQEQLEGSSKATEALVWAIPGHQNQVGTISDEHWDWGLPALMHIRDLLTADMVCSNTNYRHFWYWTDISIGLGPDYLYSQFPWNWYYEQVLACNKVIAAVDSETTNPDFRFYLGTGYASRAITYLDFVGMYETWPCPEYTDGRYNTDGNDVVGLTVPIIDENTTEEQMRNNPRVDHETMFNFIYGDLDKAIEMMSSNASARPNKALPDLTVAYGAYARACLWDASFQAEVNNDAAEATRLYNEASRYANLAMAGYSVTTQDEWLSKTSGFNDSSVGSWMLAGIYTSEDDSALYPSVGWTGWVGSEHTFGYSSYRRKTYSNIAPALYNRLSNRDFRKLSFVAPEGSPLKGREPFISPDDAAENFPQPYANIKFRPGSGNETNASIGGVVDYPLMRVEEMYFIDAEATAHVNPTAGRQKLVDFIRANRNPIYTCNLTDADEIVEEIVFQKRIELWGEGRAYYDIKRLNYPITRVYEGSTFVGKARINTKARAAWLNMCITNQEVDNNPALDGYNVPAPSDLYKRIQ